MTEGAEQATEAPGPLAIAMSGGGARAAYQVGVMLSIAKRLPDLAVPVLTGVSAGAINAAYYAQSPSSFRETTERLAALWRALTPEQVFRSDTPALGWNVIRWCVRLLSGGASVPQARGLVDTSPLRTLLRNVLRAESGTIDGVRENLERGRLSALAITASSYTTGKSVTWVSGGSVPMWERPGRTSRPFVPDVEHVMASSAVPLLFPAITVDGTWYGDGGMRLIAPLSPAIHLGAGRILGVSTRFGLRPDAASTPVPYPPPAQVGGAILEAIFLDTFDADALRLEQTNALIERLPPEDRYGLRKVDLLVLRPSVDIGKIVGDYERHLPRSLRFLMRGLGTQQTRHHSLLSMLMFQRDYLDRLISLGEQDADANPAITKFLAG